MPKEKTRESIIEAAQEVFSHKGVSKTTLEDIAKHLSASTPSGAKIDMNIIKSEFPKIDDVIEEIIGHDIDESSELFTRIMNERGKADIKLTRLVRDLLTRYQKSYPLFLAMSIGLENLGVDDEFIKNKVRKEHIERYRQNTAIIGRLIAQGQSENLFTDVDPLEAAYFLRGMIGAAIRYRRLANREDDMRDHADTIMRIFLKGLLR
ncbi:MAG: TetR family transcriptional regulator [bacterium]|nr:TetR family transcriptional regulator [Candidatus Sumerlaeota bacterium]